MANPGFENQLANWQQYTLHSTPGSSVTADNSRAVDGTYSARIDMLSGKQIGFMGLYQVLPFPQGKLLFNNITDASNGFDFWFYVEPKYDGPADFLVRFVAPNAREMDYVFDPDPALSYPNTTFPDGRVFVKTILLYGYPTGQWHHLSRNLRADWTSPTKMSTGEYLQGFGLNESVNWVEFDAMMFQSYTGQTYSETVWVDNVNILYDTDTPPLPPPPEPNTPATTTSLWIITIIGLALTMASLGLLLSRKKKQTARMDPAKAPPDL